MLEMSEINTKGVLTCPLCGTNFCPIFYGFKIVYPNFDAPKRLDIELEYICTQNDNKISSIEISRYLQIIELNSKFNNNLEYVPSNNIKMENISVEEINEDINQFKNNFNNIIDKLKDVNLTNKEFINRYIKENNECSENIKYFLLRYIELNEKLYLLINIILINIKNYEEDNFKMSFLYINRLLYYFEFLKNDKLYITRELIEKYINTNDIIVLPFIVKLNKIYPQSSGRETLKGHTLPIVGLAQMKNGLILSGSYGLLKIWKKNCDIKSDNYSCFEILHTVNYYNDLIQNFIELEENTIAFIKGKQIFEAIINKDGPQYFKESFQYQIAGNCLESLTSINNNNHLVGGLYQKIYIYKRNNPFPIYTLQYHEFFIKRLISIPVLNLFCSSGSDHKIILYNAENFEFFNAFNFEESHIVGLCNYNDTDFCASTMGGKLWYFKWNEKNNNHDRIGPINAHQKEIYGITQLKNGNVVSVSRDSTIKIWDVDKLICLCKIETCANDLVIQLIDGRLCCASNNHLVSIYNNLPIVKEFNFFSL